jgi:hypothetical protein
MASIPKWLSANNCNGYSTRGGGQDVIERREFIICKEVGKDLSVLPRSN